MRTGSQATETVENSEQLLDLITVILCSLLAEPHKQTGVKNMVPIYSSSPS
jgi:hypothetical protein